jgi:hypothetical protein
MEVILNYILEQLIFIFSFFSTEFVLVINQLTVNIISSINCSYNFQKKSYVLIFRKILTSVVSHVQKVDDTGNTIVY